MGVDRLTIYKRSDHVRQSGPWPSSTFDFSLDDDLVSSAERWVAFAGLTALAVPFAVRATRSSSSTLARWHLLTSDEAYVGALTVGHQALELQPICYRRAVRASA